MFLMMENSARRKHFVICPLANFYVIWYVELLGLWRDYKQVHMQTVRTTKLYNLAHSVMLIPPLQMELPW